jgi:hypothetical protein
MANPRRNSSRSSSRVPKLRIRRFKLDIIKRKPKPLKKEGLNGNFLVDIDGLPGHYPTPPEILVDYITRAAILSCINRGLVDIELKSQNINKQLSFKPPYFIDTNSWILFRSFFSVGVTYEIASQNNLSKILSTAWKKMEYLKDEWGTFHQFYHSFRTSEPDLDISFQIWLNLKYRKPKDYLIVHNTVCDKLFSVLGIANFLKVNEEGNYHIPNEKNKDGKLFPITDYILRFVCSNKKNVALLQKALTKLDNELSNYLSS